MDFIPTECFTTSFVVEHLFENLVKATPKKNRLQIGNGAGGTVLCVTDNKYLDIVTMTDDDEAPRQNYN